MGKKSNLPPWRSEDRKPIVSRVAMLLGHDFRDLEAGSPKKALEDAGFTVEIVAPEREQIQDSVPLSRANADDYDGLILPGGDSPDSLRDEPGVVDFVKSFVKRRKPIAAICYGPMLLIPADGVRGRHMTCHCTEAKDLENAGARYHDQDVVVDENLVTSRQADDLESFNREVVALFSLSKASRLDKFRIPIEPPSINLS